MTARALQAALDALDRNDAKGALDALLVAYRGRRAVEIAELVVRISPAAAASAPPIAGATVKARLVAWTARARGTDAADLEVLLPGIIEGTSAQANERLLALAERPSDPRIARALTSIFATLPFQAATTRKFWTTLFSLLPTHADAGTRASLAALVGKTLERTGGAETISTRLEQLLAKCLVAIDRALVDTTLDDASASLVRRLSERIGSPSAAPAPRDVESLYAAVYDEPDDDERRLILADALQEADDPRGELIALQFARARGALDAAGKKREAALLKKHGREWLGPIARMIVRDTEVFDRGFLAEGRFHVRSTRDLVTAATAREWSTVRALAVGNDDYSSQFLVLPGEIVARARRLRVANSVPLLDAAKLFRDPRPHALETLIISRYRSPLDREVGEVELDDDIRAAIGAGPGLPSLRSLVFARVLPPRALTWLFMSTRAQRLSSIGVAVAGDAAVQEWIASLERVPRDDLAVELRGANVSATLRRSGGRWRST